MRDPLILLVNLIATLARLMGSGGLRSVVAESLGQAAIAHSHKTGQNACKRVLLDFA